jgi:hypothetical protein
MFKWKLMITTLPFVLIFLAIKFGLQYGINFSGMIKFSDIAIVLTGGIFLIGFMLAGTMSDYKESEKIPGEMVSSLETIEEALCHISVTKQNIQPSEARALVMQLTTIIDEWLYKKHETTKVYEVISQVSAKAQTLDGAALGIRVQNELHNIRKMITRIDVIARTSFIQSGYALMDTIVALVLALLMISKFDTIISQAVVCAFVSLIYIYMVRLIRDIDDPFEYEDGAAQGAAEVDLFPLVEFKQRLKGRM